MSKSRGNRKEQRKRYKLRQRGLLPPGIGSLCRSPKEHNELIQLQRMKNRRRKGIMPRKTHLISYEQNKALWMEIIKAKGMDHCFQCGYNKEFGAIDFHHKDRVGTWNNRKMRISNLILGYPTPERIEKLNTCIPLCANCHRELHIKEKTIGKTIKNNITGEKEELPLFNGILAYA